MIIYHFTAERFAGPIKRQGITLGGLLISMNPPQIKTGWIWLTKNKDWGQEWSRGTGALPYKRNEVRFTVDIPEYAQGKLRPWSQVKFRQLSLDNK